MSAPVAPHSSELLSSVQRRLVLVGMMCGVSLAALDQMVLATAVGTIAGELGNIGQAPWIFTANLLTSASAMPIWGKLGDLYGRRRVFRIAITLFVVASLLAAQSRTMPELLVCRALQGLSGGALLTVPYAILGESSRPASAPPTSPTSPSSGRPRASSVRPLAGCSSTARAGDGCST
ncbi:MAG: MFS transporter [Myxococcota bacterium]